MTPTKEELEREFSRLLSMNTRGKGKMSSFRAIAQKHQYTAQSVKVLLKGGIKKWKKIHYTIWNDSKTTFALWLNVK